MTGSVKEISTTQKINKNKRAGFKGESLGWSGDEGRGDWTMCSRDGCFGSHDCGGQRGGVKGWEAGMVGCLKS